MLSWNLAIFQSRELETEINPNGPGYKAFHGCYVEKQSSGFKGLNLEWLFSLLLLIENLHFFSCMDKFISCQRLVSVFSIRNVLVPRRSRIKFLVVPDKQTEVLSHRAPFIRYRDHSLARGFVKMRRTLSMRKKKCQLCNLHSGVRVRVVFFSL